VAAARRALRQQMGCDRKRLNLLTPAERADCARHGTEFAKAMEDPRRQKLDLDPDGRFVKNDIPYLVRQPVEGCKPRAEISDSVGQTATVASIACAHRF
jgi:hypothetical protein